MGCGVWLLAWAVFDKKKQVQSESEGKEERAVVIVSRRGVVWCGMLVAAVGSQRGCPTSSFSFQRSTLEQ